MKATVKMNITFSFIPTIQYIATSKSILTLIVCFHHEYFILAILDARRQQTNIFDKNRFWVWSDKKKHFSRILFKFKMKTLWLKFRIFQTIRLNTMNSAHQLSDVVPNSVVINLPD